MLRLYISDELQNCKTVDDFFFDLLVKFLGTLVDISIFYFTPPIFLFAPALRKALKTVLNRFEFGNVNVNS